MSEKQPMPKAWEPFTEKAIKTEEAVLNPPPPATLAEALCRAQAVMGAAVKDSLNPHFKSKYADLASVWDACRKPLTDHGLSVAQLVKADGRIVSVTTKLLHVGGESLEETLSLCALNDTPQAVGSALTYARRYALAAMVGVAPEEDDGEAAHGRDAQLTPDPPRTVVNTATGEDVPTSQRPEPPDGFHYIDDYKFRDPWHELTFRGWDQQGGSMVASTKLPKIGNPAAQAYQQGIPVKPTLGAKSPPRKGEAYLNGIELWKPEPTQQELDAEIVKQDMARKAGEIA